MKTMLAISLTILLAGCNTKTDYLAFEQIDQRTQEIAQLREQYRQQRLDPALDSIREKVVLSESYSRRQSPCANGIEEAYPTAAEKAAIRRWAEKRNDFIVQLAVMAKPSSAMPALMVERINDWDAIKFAAAAQTTANIEALAEGRMTYCQFAQASFAVNTEAERRARAWRGIIYDDFAAEDMARAQFFGVGGIPLGRLRGWDH